MNANEVIESYVRDTAACLPRKMRNDVAFELRELLGDELAARAEAAGRPADKAMALELLTGFGRPAEAARRYHERPAIIDPADTHHFAIWTLAGAVGLGVLSILDTKGELDHGGLFLQWIGILTLFFGLAGWWRRRNPGKLGWKPNRGVEYMSPTAGLFAAAMTLIFPVFMYAAPERFVETAFFGAFPGRVAALTEAFADSPLRWATLALLVASAAYYAVTGLRRGYHGWAHWAGLALNATLGAAFLAHGAPGAPTVFVLPAANAIALPIFPAIGALFLAGALYDVYQLWARITPAPSLKAA
ncbi:hypothetical protein [Caulobacter mirabilis]|uniref:Uncharacterized protein n=1 Tax=Caulobacter mirabilis TaxID=69666 RepID=A0A2D2AUZ8_9CAUL|nr:hypothetical protein [Caulobacter mirabilis]ATQ41830.1 hypothetical protein CSW64_05085 [Caulobacter mirabilis]